MSHERNSTIEGLLTADAAAARCYVEKIRGGVCVFTNGVFDILHRGHLEYLTEAKAFGHLLIVGLNTDASVRRLKGPTRPLVNEQDRAYALLTLKPVDCVVLFDTDTPADLIAKIKPSILVKGGDYKPEDIAGYDTVTAAGGKVVTLPFRQGYSTTEFLRKITGTV